VKGTFVIGDIHGCLTEAQELLDKAKISKETDLVQLGDLIDKGPDPAGICQLFLGDGLKGRVKSKLILRGNHEHKMSKYHEHVLKKEANPDYVIPTKVSPEFLKEYEGVKPWAWMFKMLPMYADQGNFRFVHAGPADLKKMEAISDRMLYMRYVHKDTGDFLPLVNMKRPENSVEWYEQYTGEKVFVFGHIPRTEPVIRPNAVGLDTGCVHGDFLTGIWLETREVVQVKAKKQYCPHLITE
jgi:serine/threonine protein phosphatase 1